MASGWIKTHRDKLNWEWFTDYKTAHFFEYILLKASHKEMKYKGKTIPKGGFWFGRKKATVESGLSEQSIRTAINHLKSTNEITIKSSPQGSIIIVNNWDKYQHVTSESTNKQPTSNQQVTTYKNVKNVKKKDGSSFSDNFVGLFDDDEIIAWLKSTGTKKIQEELFFNYDASFLKDEVTNAFFWKQENKKTRKAGLYLKTWCERSNNPEKASQRRKDELDKKLLELIGGE